MMLASNKSSGHVILVSEIALRWHCGEWIGEGGKLQYSMLQKDSESFSWSIGRAGEAGATLGNISEVMIERNF